MIGILYKSKYLILLSSISLIGCATPHDYTIYVEAQKSLSRDNVVTEAARLNALIEMTKSDDPVVRNTGIMLLQQLQQHSKQIKIEPPKGLFKF